MAEEIQRPDLRVVARILEALWRHGAPMGRTRLQQASGTNYTQFSRYLDLLVERGLLELGGSGGELPSIVLTRKGYDALAFLLQGLRDISGTAAGALHQDRP